MASTFSWNSTNIYLLFGDQRWSNEIYVAAALLVLNLCTCTTLDLSSLVSSHGGIIPHTRHRLAECENIAQQLRQICPQFDLDGIKNLWIVKPGAKSRGRGKSAMFILFSSLPVYLVMVSDSELTILNYRYCVLR